MPLSFLLTIIYFWGNTSNLFCQTTTASQLHVLPQYGNKPVKLDGTYFYLGKDSLQLTKVKFYLSQVEFYQDTMLVWKEKNSFHLVDIADANTCNIKFALPVHAQFNAIQYCLGIDSATNVAGVRGGDLDPTRGMFWAWQSGYINMKIEGISTICPTRKNAFQFHLGGYAYPNASIQKLRFKMGQATKKISLVVDIQKFLAQINLAEQYSIMIPGKEAKELSDKANKMFSIAAD